MAPTDAPMTPERWRAVRQVFEDAVDINADGRAEFLDRACGDDVDLRHRVEQMLRALDDESTLLERPPMAVDRTAIATPAVPDVIGPYRLIERIGRGGMGEVFSARRDEAFDKQVAIKLLRRGVDNEEIQRRFRRERQILANLEHPNIAQLLDGGTTDGGHPYLVMELVQGEPIDRYCRRLDLDIDARLDLFLTICDAIQFAHQSLVVHRDLKPGNILVTADGAPKLLDFGIAKLLQPDDFQLTVLPTRTGMTPMTPAYASPEQVRGQAVTTASDVYALGVLLYELLAGRRPYEVDTGNLDTLVEAICHKTPPKPSTAVRTDARDAPKGPTPDTVRLERRLSGDLDAIILRALAKDPAERYASAAQLRDDLQRHLDGHPVWARRPTPLYQAGKFIRRNRWAVAGVMVVFVSLIGFLIVLLDQQHRLLEENQRRLLQQRRAEAISGWMFELFELPAPSRSRGQRVTVRELLDKGAQDILTEFGDQPELSAELMGTMGATYAQLGLYPEGIELLRRSVDLHASTGVAEPAVLAGRMQQLADALTDLGEYTEALPIARHALDLRASIGSVDRGDEADSLARLGHLHDLMGDYPRAIEVLDEAVDLARASDRLEILAKALEYAAEVRVRLGDDDDARRLYEESLGLWESIHEDRHPEIVLLRGSLAQVSKTTSPQAAAATDAESLFRQAIDEQRRLFDGAHPVIATALNNLGLLLFEHERFAEAHEVLGQALAMQIELLGDEHPKVAASQANLANAEAALGRLAEAEARCRQACDALARRLGEHHSETGICLGNLAGLLLRAGRIDEAAPQLEQAQTILTSSLGEEHPRLTFVLNNRGQIERLRGDLDAAERHLSQAVRNARLGSDPILPQALFNLAVVLTERDAPRRAAERLDEARLVLESRGVVDGAFRLSIEARLASLWLRLDDLDRAEPIARQAYDGWRRLAGDDHPWTLSAQATLGRTLVRRGHLREADALLTDRLERLRASQPPTSSRLRHAIEHMIELTEAQGDAARTDRYRQMLTDFPTDD